MSLAKIKGKGTLFQIKISGTFVTIAHRTTLSGTQPEMGSATVDDLDSTLVDKLPTLIDPKDFTLEAWYNPSESTHIAQIQTGFAAGTIFDFKLSYASDGNTTAASETFSGFLRKFNPTNIKVDDYIKVNIAIELTTLVTYTAGTP